MARQRFIHPDFWTDPSIGKLTPTERLFFIGCFSNADDEGRLLGDPAFLRSTIFPYDDMLISEIKEIRDRVVSACANLVLYEVQGVAYLVFTKWRTYQQPRYPKASKLPPPPDNAAVVEGPAQLKACSEIDASLQPLSSKPAENRSPQIGFGLRLGLDRVGLGDEIHPSPPPPEPPADASPSERSTLAILRDIPGWPFDFGKDLAHLRELAVDFPQLDLAGQVKKLRDYLKDKPLSRKSNPRLRLRNWCEKEAQWARERGDQRHDATRADPDTGPAKDWYGEYGPDPRLQELREADPAAGCRDPGA